MTWVSTSVDMDFRDFIDYKQFSVRTRELKTRIFGSMVSLRVFVSCSLPADAGFVSVLIVPLDGA